MSFASASPSPTAKLSVRELFRLLRPSAPSASAAEPAPAWPSCLPLSVGKFPSHALTLCGVVRAVVALTPRLTFLALADDSAEEQLEGSGCERTLQLVIKSADGVGWSAAQQALLRAGVRVGARLGVHGFLEINPPTAAAASDAAQANVQAVEWARSKPAAAAAPDAASAATSPSAASSSTAAPAAPVESALCVHALSIALLDSESSSAHNADYDALVLHSASIARILVANEELRLAEESKDDASQPRVFPDLALAKRERIDSLASAAASVASAASAASSSPSAAAAAPALSARELQKQLNRDRQRARHSAVAVEGDVAKRKRVPKSNISRGGRFYSFLEATFGVGLLGREGGVLDVAGGQGLLSFELSKRDMPCTVVDPRPIDGGAHQGKRQAYLAIRDRLAALGAREPPVVRHCACLFNEEFTSAPNTAAVWSAASVVVGLHPDEATGDIAALSLAAGKPFAVVPCCVFPTLYPHRRLRDGTPVRSHEELCRFIEEMDPGVRRTELEFEGRSTVLFHTGRHENNSEASSGSSSAQPSPAASAAL